MWGGEIPVSNDGVTIARELAEDLAAHVITCVCVCARARERERVIVVCSSVANVRTNSNASMSA